MKRESTGTWLTQGTGQDLFRSFIPNPLPPEPPVDMSDPLTGLMERALLALGRLDSVTIHLPDTATFLYTYVRKEAVLSTQIEGTQSSLSDLLLFEVGEAPGVPLDDVRESVNYIRAMEYGLKRVQEGFPLSLRLIREIHELLLARGRGAANDPGEFRRIQNWIGGPSPQRARFVPPPPNHLIECLGCLEKFLNDKPDRMPILVKAALAHVQFETIHPFLDGNGRLGRLMITLILCSEKVLREPMLYLSLYFKTHRDEYYDLLQKVRIDGDWEEWIGFFLEAVRVTAEQAVVTAEKLLKLNVDDTARIHRLGRQAGSVHQIQQALFRRPILTIPKAGELTGLSPHTINSAMDQLIALGIVHEITGKKRNRAYAYTNYIAVLNEET